MVIPKWLCNAIFWSICFESVLIRQCLAYSKMDIYSGDAWPDISPQRQNAIRSQRDVMRNITIDQIPYVGVNLRKVLFNQQSVDLITNMGPVYSPSGASGNETDALIDNFTSLLNSGLQSMVLDLEIRNNTWMIVETDLNFQQYLTTLNSFLVQSHYDLSANIQVLLLNIITKKNATIDKLVYSNPQLNLTNIIDTYLGSEYIFTPEAFLNDQDSSLAITKRPKWPTVQQFLFERHKRIIITELTSSLNLSETPYIFPRDVLHYDENNSTLSCPTNNTEIDFMKSISWRFLNAPFTVDEIKQYITCGLSPIISNYYDISNVTDIVKLISPSIVWAWEENEPRLSNSKLVVGKDSIQAYNCAKVKYISANSSLSWSVGNCYNKKVGLCKKSESESENNWLVTNTEDSFFDFNDLQEEACPEGYRFAMPPTPLDGLSLAQYLDKSIYSASEDTEIWINLNSIMVSNCWVIGENATCPYRKEVSTRNFLQMVSPVSIMSLFLLVGVFYFSLLTIPIHDNRKNWRKIVNQVSKNEFEGVPS
ncbi:maintenance of telomere capping protein 6 [Monosporozyma servazzii]